MTGLSDSFQRPINYLRISVTDRCNLRCLYCMPEEGISLLSHQDILTYEEIARVVEAAADLGITRVRLTGGEPLVRADLSSLVTMLARIPGIADLALTTNGLLLKKYAPALKAAGLKRVNISLDTLKEDRFRRITRWGRLRDVLKGLEAAKKLGLEPVKLNMVVLRGVNDDEVLDFARKTIEEGWNVRFVELMPFQIGKDGLVPVEEVRQRIQALGPLEPCSLPGGGPAEYFRFPGAKGTVGFISPVTECFCEGCNRLRLTAEGRLRPCLLHDVELDLRAPLRRGASKEELKIAIAQSASCKPQGHSLVQNSLPTRKMAQIGG